MVNFNRLALLAFVLCISLLFSCSYENEPGKDISNYRIEQIGKQVWMAENLNYNVSGSKCYNNDPANCNKYGRLYDWATAMGIDAKYNKEEWRGGEVRHQGICPSGWHIPSDAEWKTLIDSVGGSSIAGRYLKATNGWHNCGIGSSHSYQCEDKFGFSAMPGGIGYSDGKFHYIGEYGYWWSSSEYRGEDAYYRDMNYISDAAGWYNYGAKTNLLSVRCLRN